jgi:hypothetical protein
MARKIWQDQEAMSTNAFIVQQNRAARDRVLVAFRIGSSEGSVLVMIIQEAASGQ